MTARSAISIKLAALGRHEHTTKEGKFHQKISILAAFMALILVRIDDAGSELLLPMSILETWLEMPRDRRGQCDIV